MLAKYIYLFLNKYIIDMNYKNDLLDKLNNLKIKNEKIHVRNKDFKDNLYYLKYYNKETYHNVSYYLKTDIELFNIKI